MDGRAQGAMEYLMSYGWAILVVMAIGGALWQLGVLEVGGSVPATAAGFQALKPLLPTCEMRNTLWWPPGNYNGFTCQFVNGAGGEIRLKDLMVTVDGKTCYYPVLDLFPVESPTDSFYLWRTCVLDPCGGPFSVNERTSVTCWVMNAPSCYVPIPNGGQFSVMAFTNPATRTDPCANLVDGKVYDVDIEVTYEIDVGGVPATKVSSGRIRLPGKP